MNDKLKLKMERGRLVLELPDSALDLEVNGALQATYFLGRSEGPDDLRGELRKANAAKSACAMLRALLARPPEGNRTTKQWALGFSEGLFGNHREKNGTHIPPEGVVDAGFGSMEAWELGYAIRAALAIADGKPDPRQSLAE
jgi:hypothetical protein